MDDCSGQGRGGAQHGWLMRETCDEPFFLWLYHAPPLQPETWHLMLVSQLNIYFSLVNINIFGSITGLCEMSTPWYHVSLSCSHILKHYERMFL